MISRSTLLGALVVLELAIVGVAAKAVAGGNAPAAGFMGPGFPHAGMIHGATGRTAFDRSFTTGPAPHVVIDVRDIPVTVVAGSAASVRVVETVVKFGYVDGEEPIAAQQTPDGVRISAPSSDVKVVGAYDPTVRISVPPNARVELTSGGGMDATGLRQKLVAHLAEGSVEIRDHRGDVDVSTGSGSVRLVDVEADEIAAGTRDGRIYLTRIGAQRINASSASGRIVGADVRAIDGALTTRDGRIILSFTRNSDATVKAHTADGKIRVAGFPVTRSDEQNSVVRLGSGRGTFELSTENGPIVITQGASV
ncbi:MAG TPA: DUF4097 family beta strand repeat-containing protein [Candidatus Elarobacter sp.]|jgi:hypothetical protein